MIFALYIQHASGYLQVRTFDTAFLRALEMITLSPQPVTLTTRDYPEVG